MIAKRALGFLRGGSLALLFAGIAGMSAPVRTANAAVTVMYVKWDASGSNNGASWSDAYKSLQSALDAAAGGGYEIWVAAGIYRPFRSFPPSVFDTFQLHNNVALYGGFVGTETQRSQRNWQTNVTTLYGDWFYFGSHHYAYHVVTGSGANSSAVLDGFTVAAGNAQGTSPDNAGGGMRNVTGSPTVSNVIFSGNSATSTGGGVFNFSSSPTLTNVTFSGNSAHWGGGIYNYSGSPMLTNVIFSDNSAADSGGGMYNTSSSPTVTNATFSSNSAIDGGGMANETSSPTLTNLTFSGNFATVGGGMYNSTSSASINPTLTNATFSGNSASEGGGMYNVGSNPLLTNITFSGNSANSGGGISNVNYSSPTIVNSVLWGNTAPTGAQIHNLNSSSPGVTYSDVQGGHAGIGNLNSDSKFIRAPSPGGDGTWGTGDDDYGDLHLQPDSPVIDAASNAAVPPGVTTDRDGNPRIMGIKADMGAYEAFPVRISLPLIRR